MKKIELISFEKHLDECVGKRGTTERDALEQEARQAVYTYELGKAIKQARLKQNLTQEELGEKIGVQRAQISRIEKGYSLSLQTISRVFRALGAKAATLDLGNDFGKVALW